jgi:NAD+ synthetase
MNLTNLVSYTQAYRGFNVQHYLKDKLKAINKFFSDNGLDSAVVGVSGGVDSAVVLGLLSCAKELPDSPIKKIMAVALPIVCDGTTGQDDATRLARKVMQKYGQDKFQINLSKPFESYIEELEYGVHRTVNSWVYGQIASIFRTPMLYGAAALLQSEGYNSIVVGTTNRDEGSYIGFFGKASDAMVDLQPIADIHKSEVYKAAEALGVPMEVMERYPMGDVWDGRHDEQMIGAPYWFLETYLLLKEMGEKNKLKSLPDTEINATLKWTDAIESLHNKNAHKYKVGNPAHFIDVMPRKIPGGWQ